MLSTSTQLKILSLKYCKYVNKDILIILNQVCNPFTLQELYLDGCEEISDESLECLVMKDDERLFIRQSQFQLEYKIESIEP